MARVTNLGELSSIIKEKGHDAIVYSGSYYYDVIEVTYLLDGIPDSTMSIIVYVFLKENEFHIMSHVYSDEKNIIDVLEDLEFCRVPDEGYDTRDYRKVVESLDEILEELDRIRDYHNGLNIKG